MLRYAYIYFYIVDDLKKQNEIQHKPLIFLNMKPPDTQKL